MGSYAVWTLAGLMMMGHRGRAVIAPELLVENNLVRVQQSACLQMRHQMYRAQTTIHLADGGYLHCEIGGRCAVVCLCARVAR